MYTESELNSKWLGSHFNSCQRRQCKNPKRNLINCFSCQRAFCKPCWKKVKKMPPVMKAAKGFQTCSIQPQKSQQLNSHLDRTHQEQSLHTSIQAANMVNSLRDPPTKQIPCFDLSDSDDSEIEIQERPWASEFSVPKEVGSQIPPTSKLQQSDAFSQSGKRRIEDGGEDIESNTAKRSKSTFPISSIPTTNVEPLEYTSSSHSQSNAVIHSYDGLNGGGFGRTYISEGQYHTMLEDLDRKKACSGLQEQEPLVIARKALLCMGDNALPGNTPKIGCGPRTHHTRGICEPTATTGDAEDSSMLDSGEIERIGQVLNSVSEDGNGTVREVYESTSKERSLDTSHIRLSPCSKNRSPSDATCRNAGPPPVPIPQGDLVPKQGTAENLGTPMPHSAQVRSPRAQGSSHHALMNFQSKSACSSQQLGGPYHSQVIEVAPSADFQRGYPVQEMPNSGVYGPRNSPTATVSGPIREQQTLDRQTVQSHLPTYHQHKIPSLSPQPPQDPLSQHSPAILQACLIPRFPGPNSYAASHSSGLPRPSQMPNSVKTALRSDIPPSGYDKSLLADFEYAFTDFEIEHLPANQKKIGDGWLSLYNPQVLRTLEINLLHTFSLKSTVCCVRFSPDGRHLATGFKNTAKIFDTVTGKSEFELSIESIADSKKDIYVRSVCFSPDGRLLAIASEDRLIRVSQFQSYCLYMLTRSAALGHQIEK
jgi:hypothetical protein